MVDSKIKVEYTAVPSEDPEKSSDLGSKNTDSKMHPDNDGLPTHFVNDATHECYFKRYREKRRAWSKTLILLLLVFFASRMLFGWLVVNNESNDEDPYLWIETQEPHCRLSGFPFTPKCEPIIKWEGPSEILVDQKNISGLIFKVKGMSPHGSVIIRQDKEAKNYINVTNHIYVGNESLQEKIDIKISYIDDDYSITVETPSFNFPPNEKNCIRVDTIITIPHKVNVFRSLSIDFPNSWITADSLGKIDFAYVNLKTINGHIRVDDLSVANADVSTVNGHINGAFVVGESLEVRSIHGPVNVNAIPNPWSDSISVVASSFNGNLNIGVDELMKHHKIDLKGRSINGGIVATMPKTYKGDFLVSSITGYAYVEGQGITFRKDTRNHKEGYKNAMKKHHCNHVRSLDSLYDINSNLTLTVVNGASELYFV